MRRRFAVSALEQGSVCVFILAVDLPTPDKEIAHVR